jgi:hypothetical protein
MSTILHAVGAALVAAGLLILYIGTGPQRIALGGTAALAGAALILVGSVL